MAFVRIFDWGENLDTGVTGWVLRRAGHGDPASGFTIAHDVLEHFPNKWSGIGHEMMAFGCLVYLRVEGGWFYNEAPYGSVASTLTSDLYRFLVEEGGLRVQPRPTRKLDENEELESLVEDMRDVFKRMWESEGYYGDKCPWPMEEGLQALEHCFDWMRHGYRQARKRYPQGYALWCEVFKELTAQVEKPWIARGEYGQSLHVYVDTDQPRSWVRLMEGRREL